MASAQARSDTRGRPPPKRCVLMWAGSRGCSTAHSSSEIRNPIVAGLFGVRARPRFEFSAFSSSFWEQSHREQFTEVIERGSLLSSGYVARDRRKHGSHLHSCHGEVTLRSVPGQGSRAW